MCISYFIIAFIAFLVMATGPSKLSWSLAFVRLAGLSAFPFSFFILILPIFITFSPEHSYRVTQLNAETIQFTAEVIVSLGTAAGAIFTLGTGICLLKFVHHRLAAAEASSTQPAIRT